MEKIEIIPESIKIIKMTDEEYFSDKYRDYISNSRLALINPEQGGSYELYKTGIKSGYSDSFELGSAVHAIILQPEYYRLSNVKRPTGKLGQFANKVYDYEKIGMKRDLAIDKASIDADYYAGKLTDKRLSTALDSCQSYWENRKLFEESIEYQIDTENQISHLYLSEAMTNKLEQCLIGTKNEPKIEELLRQSGLLTPAETYNEYAILAELIITIDNNQYRLKIKAKLDNFTVNHETQEIVLNDLKTTGKPVNFFMGNYVKIEGQEEKVWYDGSFQQYHYARQMGAYLWLLNCAMHYTRSLDYSLKANMLVVETIPDFKSRVYALSKSQIQKGLDEFKQLLILVIKNDQFSN